MVVSAAAAGAARCVFGTMLHWDAYRRQSVAACDGGGRVGHAVRRRGRGAGRAWRAAARHCGAGVRGARCRPLSRARPARPRPAPPCARTPAPPPRPHRAFEASASDLQPRAPAATTHAAQHTLSIDCGLRFCTFQRSTVLKLIRKCTLQI